MKRSKEENNLLKKLASGLLDGLVGSDLETSGGSRVWTEIKMGNQLDTKKDQGEISLMVKKTNGTKAFYTR
ncbi:hypothetical protein AALA61_06825 [Oscillospiraceae bacterium 42-9]